MWKLLKCCFQSASESWRRAERSLSLKECITSAEWLDQGKPSANTECFVIWNSSSHQVGEAVASALKQSTACFGLSLKAARKMSSALEFRKCSRMFAKIWTERHCLTAC